MQPIICVEIGPGNKRLGPEWTTVGPYEDENVDYVCRWGTDKLPFEDNSVDLLYASHVLEHIWWYKTIDALKDALRILKPNGKFELHVPDFNVIIQAYKDKSCGDLWFKYNPEKDFMTWINGRIFTYGGPGNIHRALFDEAYLKKCLIKAGFSTVQLGAPIRGNNHGKINLAVTAIK